MTTQQPVIPPVAVEEFTCAGNGLLYEEHPRESPAELRLLLLPQGDKNGISDRDRKVYNIEPKAWWLAQNKFYGLAQAKATPINLLRSKLEDALRTPNGMRVPEKILNLEAEGNRKYKDLSQLVLQETQTAKKGKGKAATGANPASVPVPAAGSKPKPAAAPKPKATASSSKGKDPVKPAPAKKASAKASAAPAPGASTSSNAGPGYAPEPPAPRTKVTARKTTGGKPPLKTELGSTAGTSTGTKGPGKAPKMEEDGFEILNDFDELARELPPVKKTYVKKTGGGLAPRKRARSPDRAEDGPSNKRIKPDDDDSMFGFLTGTYDISAPDISNEWDYARDLNLVVSLDSERRLFCSFRFGICSGVLRSTDDIEARVDGASAKFEWCGQEEYGGDQVYTPRWGMKGVLRFTRRKRDGRHTIKGVIEDVPALGKCDFTGVKVDDSTAIYRRWDDFNEDAYERANEDRWR